MGLLRVVNNEREDEKNVRQVTAATQEREEDVLELMEKERKHEKFEETSFHNLKSAKTFVYQT